MRGVRVAMRVGGAEGELVSAARRSMPLGRRAKQNNPHAPTRVTPTGAGWATIGDQRCYFRSGWERRYALYLEWLRQRGEIRGWEFEPRTFWFDAIKRGVRSYLPDFLIVERDGSEVFHEVKGFMDQRSRTKIKRMAKYHPNVKLIVIGRKQLTEIARSVGALIQDWST